MSTHENDEVKRTSLPALDHLRQELIRTAHEERSQNARRGVHGMVVIGLALLLLGAGTVGYFGFMYADRPGRDADNKPVGGFAASGPRYQNLAELLAASGIVLKGTVEGVAAATSVGPPEEAIWLRSAIVRVEEVWKGSITGPTVTVRTLELAYTGPRDEEWRQQGTRVVLLLSPSRDVPGTYIPAATNYAQTIYVIKESDLVPAVAGDPLATRVAELGLAGLKAAAVSADA